MSKSAINVKIIEIPSFDSKRPDRLVVEVDKAVFEIPIFDVRNDFHKIEIAKKIASYEPGVAFGVGLYGFFVYLRDPKYASHSNHKDAAEAFKIVKPTRSEHDKVTTYITPEKMGKIIDFKKIHPQFRKLLKNEKYREKIWRQGVAFHLVVPITANAVKHLHPLLVSTPEDAIATGRSSELQKTNTISAFWWHDPDMHEIADLVEKINPHGVVGMSSFNEHGEDPAFNYSDLKKYILEKGKFPAKFAIRDRIGEEVGVRSSHPQFRVPLVGEPAEWVVVRDGAISIEGFLKAINSPFPYRRLQETKMASRGHDKNASLDNLVFQVRDLTEADYYLRHPKKPNLIKRLFKVPS